MLQLVLLVFEYRFGRLRPEWMSKLVSVALDSFELITSILDGREIVRFKTKTRTTCVDDVWKSGCQLAETATCDSHHDDGEHPFGNHDKPIELTGRVRGPDVGDLKRVREDAGDADDGQRRDPNLGTPGELLEDAALADPDRVLLRLGEDPQQEEGAPALDQGDAAEVADVQPVDELLASRGVAGRVATPAHHDEGPDHHGYEDQGPVAHLEDCSTTALEDLVEDQVAVEREAGFLDLFCRDC